MILIEKQHLNHLIQLAKFIFKIYLIQKISGLINIEEFTKGLEELKIKTNSY